MKPEHYAWLDAQQLRPEFEERAGIYERSMRLSRVDAESRAWADVIAMFNRWNERIKK